MQNDYPTLRFLERHGGWISGIVALTPLVSALAYLAVGGSAWWLLPSLLAGAAIFVVIRSYIELIRLMSDMLIPK